MKYLMYDFWENVYFLNEDLAVFNIFETEYGTFGFLSKISFNRNYTYILYIYIIHIYYTYIFSL